MRLAAITPSRSTLRGLTPPRALGALLGIVAVVGLCWALTVPPWQSPDEFSHYAYAESLATSFRLPGNPHDEIFSTDEAEAATEMGAALGAQYPQSFPPAWSRAAYDAYLHADTRGIRDRANGGGVSTASNNPPLYYLYASLGYLIDSGGTAYGRLYAMRLQGVILLLLTTLGAWLIAGETFGRRRLAQLVTAATVALLPMSAFMSTNVNPDALLITTWTFAIWLGARIINRHAQLCDVVAMCAVLAAAILTKDTSYALAVPELFAVGVGLWRRPSGERVPALPGVAGSALVAVVPVGFWLARSRSLGGTGIEQVGTGGNAFNVRQFLSYLWQFYLPRLPFMTRFRLTPTLPLNDIWIEQGTGEFGWLDVNVPGWMFDLARVLLACLVVVSGWLLTKLRGGRQLSLLAFDLLVLIFLLGLLHVTEYRSTLGGGGQFLQGRYLLPAVSLLGLTVGLLVSRLPRAARAPVAAVVLVGLLAGQAISLTTILHAYYL